MILEYFHPGFKPAFVLSEHLGLLQDFGIRGRACARIAGSVGRTVGLVVERRLGGFITTAARLKSH